MTARDLIEIREATRGESEYRTAKVMSGADYITPSANGSVHRFKFYPADGTIPFCSVNVIHVKGGADAHRLLASIDLREYVRPSSGTNMLLPSDIYRAVSDALLRRECAEWRGGV